MGIDCSLLHFTWAEQGRGPALLFAAFLDQATPVEYLCIYLVFDVVFATISFGKSLSWQSLLPNHAIAEGQTRDQ